MIHRPLDTNASLLQGCSGCFSIDLLDRERGVLRWPSSLVLLENDDAGWPTSPQEQPPAAFIPHTDFKSRSFPIEDFGLCEILDTDGYFVKTANGQHVIHLSY